MDRSKTISWVVSVCAVYIRLSQAKTLGTLITSAMRNRRISLANLGRQMTGTVKPDQARLALLRQRWHRGLRRHARHRRPTGEETKEAVLDRVGLGGHQGIPDVARLGGAQGTLDPAVLEQLSAHSTAGA